MFGHRLRVLVGWSVAALTTSLLIAAPSSAAPPPSPWLQTDYNAAGSRANLAETTLSAANVARVVPQRTLSGAGNSCEGLAGPVFSDSHTYVVVNQVLKSFDTNTGRLVWWHRASTTDYYYVSIAVSHGLVILGADDCGSTDPNGYVDAYRTADGSPAWSGQVSFPDGLAGVVVSGQRVMAFEYAGTESAATTQVLDVFTGRPVWSVGPAENYCTPEPYVVGGLAFGLSCSRTSTHLVARDIATGAVRWTKRGAFTVLRGDLDTSAGANLYVARRGTVYDLDPKTAATRFVLAGATDVLAVDATRAYADCSTDGSLVCAYDIGTGAKIWQDSDPGYLQGATIEANGVLYLGDGLVVSAATGAALTTLPGNPVLVGNGRVGVANPQDGTVTIFGLPQSG